MHERQAGDDVKIATMRARIEEASRITESSIQLARSAVLSVRDEARRSIAERVAALSETRSSDSLTQAFAALEQRVSVHLDAVLARVDQQQELARRAASRCDRIIESVRRLDDVAFAAKVLSLNAYISASSLAGGKVVAILATRLSALTTDVATMNEGVAASAEQLLQVLPQVAAKAAALRGEALAFAEHFRAAVERLTPRATTMNRIADQVVHAGDTQLRAIVASSVEAYEALDYGARFEDGLHELRRLSDDVANTVERLAG